MHNSKIKHITLAVCMAFLPLSSFAAGLGKLSLNSGLGEPLKAEVELLSMTPEELSSLVASIASEEAYAAQGITRLGVHNIINVEVAKGASGAPILRLRTSQPITDPYLDMLIQVDWASGRLQREYTVLLDPPGYKEPSESVAPMAIKPPVATTSTGNTTSNSDSNDTYQSNKKPIKSRNSSKSSIVTPKKAVPVNSELSGDELTTKKGDTLNSIAKKLKVEGVSLDQMLVGIYEGNKEAFAGNNMNRLKAGQIIKVPSKDSLLAIDTNQAHQQIKIQSDNWNAYRNKLAGSVDSAPSSADGEQKQAASGKIGNAEDKAASAKTGPQDVVKLSAGDKVKSGNANGNAKGLEDKITALQEETTAREKALKDAQERTAALEKQIQDMQKLLALKNQAMANVQKNAEATKVPEPTVSSKVTTPAKVAEATPPVTTPRPVEAVKADPVAAIAPTPETKPTESNSTDPKSAEVKQAETKPAEFKQADKKTANPVVVAPAPKPVVEPSFLEGLMNGIDLTVIGGVGGVALLGAGWMYLRNKRRKDLDSFERGILTSGGLRANTVFGNTTGNASTSDTSFLTDFAQSADGSMIDTNDVDPIAEAEVYMAYGRDAQAEEILKDAISKEPKRYELHLKLLEMYAARKDTSAFEAIAGELYTTLGANDPTWAKVAEIGAAMEPENPLYDVSKIAVMSADSTQKLDASDFANVPVSDEADLDFSLDDNGDVEDANSVVAQSFASSTDSDGNDKSPTFDLGSTFELGSLDEAPIEKSDDLVSSHEAVTNLSTNTDSPISKSSEDNTMDFDMGDFDLGGIESKLTKSDLISGEDVDSLKTMDNLPAFETSITAEPTTTSAEAPAFDLPSFESTVSAETALPDADTSDFDLDFNLPTDSAAETPINNEIKAEDIAFDFDMGDKETNNAPALESNEISFDLPEIVDTAPSDNLMTIPEAPNDFDFSSINLDLNDSAGDEANNLSTYTIPDAELGTMSAELTHESEDVDIKLDLVSAYIDMGDKEGARELLEEVLKEGGVQQQAKAQHLLSSLV